MDNIAEKYGNTDHAHSQNSDLSFVLGRAAVTDDDIKLQNILSNPIFHKLEDRTSEERSQQAYKALKLLIKSFPLSREDILFGEDKLLRLHEWTGFVNGTLLTLLTIHYNLCLGCILQNKSDTQDLDNIINKLLTGEIIGVFLATELGYGNNVINLKTEAHFDNEKQTFRIHTPFAEAKKFMPNTGLEGVPKIACVLAKLVINSKNQGIFPFIVPIRDDKGKLYPGINVTPLSEKPGYDLDNAITWFDDIEIPLNYALLGNTARIDSLGNFTCEEPNLAKRFMRAIDRVQTGKLCLSGGVSHGLKSVIKITFNYSKQRKTFSTSRRETSIFSYNNHKNSLIESLVKVSAMNLFYEWVTIKRQNCKSESEHNYYLAALKSYVSSESIIVLNELRERIGAQGLFSINGIIDHIITAHGVLTAEGDNHVIKIKMANDLLYKQLFSLNPPSYASHPSFFDYKFQEGILTEMVYMRCKNISNRLAQAKHQGERLFERWNREIPHSLSMVDSHISLLIFRSLTEQQLSSRKHSSYIIHLIRTLFFILEIEKYKGDYILYEILDRQILIDLRDNKQSIIDKLYEMCDQLVNGLQIPDTLIKSPLIGDYVDYFNNISSPIKRMEA